METTPTAPGLAAKAGLAIPPGVYGIPPQSGPAPLPFVQSAPQPVQQIPQTPPGTIRVRPTSVVRIEFDRLGATCEIQVYDPVGVVTAIYGVFRDKEQRARDAGEKSAGPAFTEDLEAIRKIIMAKSSLHIPDGAGSMVLTDTEVDAIGLGMIEWHATAGKTSSPAQT